MQSGCTVIQLLFLCMFEASPKCCYMAKRLAKGENLASSTKNFCPPLPLSTMWTFIFLHSVYIALTLAQTTSPPQACPNMCQCSGLTVRCRKLGLKRIPNNIPKDVAILDLSGNNISSIENGIFLQFPKLIQLDLGNNGIKTVGSMAFTGLLSLRELKLNGNNLTQVPNLSLKALTALDMRSNQLESLPKYKLYIMTPSLQFLYLSKNKIKSLQAATFSGMKLKSLYLDNNLLTNVNAGSWLYWVHSLEHLYLQNNQIVNISANSWDSKLCCGNLKLINLANNNLRRVLLNNEQHGYGGRFAELPSLDSLNLSSNGIYLISDEAFKSLKKLRVLDLSNNKLSWTLYDDNRTFKGLQKLEKLNLRQNDITSVVKVMFEPVPTVEKLDMTNNPVEEVTQDAFKPLRILRDLRMNSRSLYCSCKLRWFSQWLAAKKFPRAIVLKCSQPKQLAGREFSKLAVDDLVCGATRPEITEHPKSQVALKGDEIRLSCTVKNGSIEGIKIIWTKDTKQINSNHSDIRVITQETNNKFVIYQSVLRLRNVQESKDSGLYQCVVVTRVGEMKSRKATLEVVVPPQFTSKPRNVVTRRGTDVRFNCSASGSPRPKISFSIVKHSRMAAIVEGRIDLEGDTFVIRNVTLRDVGLYMCSANNVAGKINTTFHINILGKPVAEQQMLGKVSLVHDAIVFVCSVTAYPPPDFTWYKDGKPVDLTSSNILLRRVLNAEHLVILKAKYIDAGVYTCLVSNALGVTKLTSRLRVVEDLPSKNVSSQPGSKGYTYNRLIATVVFTASLTMVITTIICIAIIHTLSRRGRGLCPTGRKAPGADTLDSFTGTGEGGTHDYYPITENTPSETPRSSSTFITTSDSQTSSDSNFLQTSSSDSGSTKENHEGSYDGRHSSGVCSMNSSTSSLASANANHRNTFPFSNTPKTFLYPATASCFYDASDDGTSCGTKNHRPQRQTLLWKYNDEHFPARRKPKPSSRSRERHVNKRRKEQENERTSINIRNDDLAVGVSTEEYLTEPDATTI